MSDETIFNPEEEEGFLQRAEERRVRLYELDKRLLPPELFNEKWPEPLEEI